MTEIKLKKGWKDVKDQLRLGKPRIQCAESRGLKGCWQCKSTTEAFHCEEWTNFDSILDKWKRKLRL